MDSPLHREMVCNSFVYRPLLIYYHFTLIIFIPYHLRICVTLQASKKKHKTQNENIVKTQNEHNSNNIYS